MTWDGIARCLQSILAAGPLLETYADNLVTQGFRPCRDETDEPADEPDVVDARLEEDDDDVDDERFHVDEFHVWGDRYWDLNITVTDDLDIDSEAERLDMDSLGRADVWKDLEAGTRKTRCKLVSERCGLTAQMLGIDAIMADAL